MNQYSSPKRDLRALLDEARRLVAVDLRAARYYLKLFWMMLETVPASTRRRWRCGR